MGIYLKRFFQFSAITPFFLNRSDECGRVFVYRKNGTRFDADHIQIKDTSGRMTVPVWGWFSAGGAGDFVRIAGKFNKEKYLEILQNVLLPSIQARFPNQQVRFIHDLSPIHQAIVIRSWFREHPEIAALPWPPKGADLNPIENHWGNMVKDLEYFRPKSPEEVYEKARACWDSYRGRPDYWQKFALSITNRLQLVIDANGYWTRY